MPTTDLPGEPPDAAAPETQGAFPVTLNGAGRPLAVAASGLVAARAHHPQPVVGLGGSAGSFPALRAFLSRLPADSGLAFVVVVHLPPDRDSHLAALLQAFTPLPVVQVRETLRVEPNRVYVIPPARQLSMADGQLRLSALSSERSQRAAIDLFFRSLAGAHGPQAAAIVVSGAGADGALGLKRVKERGGLTIAQEPSEAELDGMPRAAIATGMVDWVLPAAQMPERLLQYYRRGKRLRLPAEGSPEPRVPEAEAALREVLSLVRARTGHDISDYKRPTLLRRLGRRLQVNGLEDLRAYLAFLRAHPGEAGALLQDVLISVTHFFRDPEAFAALQTEIPRLFAGKQAGDSVRVWVVGCATGEEAYSIAMLLAERASQLPAPPSFQVFATDLNAAAIQAARAGLYPEAIMADVSEERLRRFFSKAEGGYRVNRALRETVIFAVHDALKDPPFSHLDLVSCRNLLIYLNRAAQRRLLERFHFALRPEGLLFLGPSESVEEAGGLFRVLNKARGLHARAAVSGPGAPASGRGGTLVWAPAFDARHPQAPAASADSATAGRGRAPSLLGALHFKLLEGLAPGSALIDQNGCIVHLSGRAQRYLRLIGAEASLELLRVVHPGLRPELRAALLRVRQTGKAVQVRGVPVELGGGRQVIDLHVRPAQDLAPGFALVAFDERAAEGAAAEGAAATDPADPHARPLEAELDRLKAQQRAMAEAYDASLEELKASNEELQAINEELRSATEEFEASREDLQATNAELNSVNQELKAKVEELGRANADLQNLMAATDIATVFLDRELRIQRYTPAAVRLFRLIPTDIGRPLADLSQRLENGFIVAEAQRVLERLAPVEREARADGRWFLARIQPYRTIDDRVAGVVLTFVDTTGRKRLEQEVLDISGREQRRIGHDLHDALGQQLGAIQLLSGVLAAELATESHPRAPQAERISEQTRQALECARSLARGLAPVTLEADGLGAALQELAASSARRFGIRCEFRGRGGPEGSLDPEAAAHLYRIVQEAIANAVRHGHAGRVTIELTVTEAGAGLTLKVTDDGRGFDPTIPSSGMGLRIMKYRAAMIGASLEVHSRPGAGATVTCAFAGQALHRPVAGVPSDAR